ncbi:MAG: hypothetical protein DUD33_07825 [Coriobacteriaceae bacterium]|jgi:hypothetical protein|nr:hypothetical protein [Olsenella sp.]MCI1289112.1 hypothetical protein [Olsenella sp.]RRF89303.1 MAG: hypothetical protein DUD33_07825 [Coriobacteriaceae bacterium]
MSHRHGAGQSQGHSTAGRVIHGQAVDAGKVHDHEYHACARKRRYESKAEAKKAASHGASRKDAPQLYAYKCEICGGWHLTHRKPR